MKFGLLGGVILAGGLSITPVIAQNLASPNPGAPNSDGKTLATSLMGSRVQQVHGGYLSSKLVGATVYDDQNQSIGSIDNLIIGENGQVNNAIISVGGFLGIDAKLVNVPFAQLKFHSDGGATGRQVVLPNVTKQSLQSMQSFSYNG